MRRKLLPHEKAAFLLSVEKRASVFGAMLWTIKSLALETEGAIVSFAEFFAVWAVGAVGHGMTWAFVMWVLTSIWLRRNDGYAFVVSRVMEPVRLRAPIGDGVVM